MKEAFELELLQNECIQLINKIPETSDFGIVLFSINLKGFTDEMVSATPEQKAAAEDWIKNNYKKLAGIPSRGDGVIKNGSSRNFVAGR